MLRRYLTLIEIFLSSLVVNTREVHCLPVRKRVKVGLNSFRGSMIDKSIVDFWFISTFSMAKAISFFLKK